MKKHISLVISILVSTVTASALTVCDSQVESALNDGQNLKVQFTIISPTEIQQVVVGLYNVQNKTFRTVVSKADVKADANYHPKNPRAQLFNLFDLSETKLDDYDLFLPKTLSPNEPFDAYLRVSFEHNKPVSHPLKCQSR